MDVQTPSNNQSCRTYWTPAMERFFVDLMLEHMQKGNRYGHTFNKHAWADMLSVFNARFGSKYDKDALKARYTNLWKQFNDIKILLADNRFSWDETHQMVVSDDYTWEAYMKDHPEARPYKTKVVINFHDLCFIYGYTVADGRYSRSSHDMDVEEDAGLDGTGTIAPPGFKCSKVEWTTDMDNYFLELLRIQDQKGNKLENTFSKQDWTDMLLLFNAKFGPQHHKRVLKQRYKKLGKCYRDLTTLIQQKGFSWDEKQNMVTASDDVWDAYIKAHPHGRSFRVNVFPNYSIMSLLFRNAENKGSQIVLLEDKDREDQVTVRKTGSERSRTHWTPPMDGYFIELMLDHVRRGNRIGQAFITQSWIEMVTSFNVRFKSNHDKEVLKNRYKHFRRLYNEVKVILENSDFSWDHEREMVTAEDHVWEAYIKAHPHARPFSVKTVPFFNKLCVIYGSDNCDEVYSRFAWNSDQDAGSPVQMLDGAADSPFPNNADTVAEWTPSMEHHFIELLLNLVQGDEMFDPLLEELAWSDLVSSFNEKFRVKYDKDMLKAQYRSLMKQYDEISILLNQDGFTWDETQQTIVADDSAWEAQKTDNIYAISYKDKVLGCYNDLCIIFGSTRTQEGQFNEIEIELGSDSMDIRMIDLCEDLLIPVPITETSDHDKKRKYTSSRGMENIAKFQKVHQIVKQEPFVGNSSGALQLVQNMSGMNYSAIGNAIEALQAVPGIDDDFLLDACDLLEDETKAKTFLALDAALRKKWLLRKIKQQ